MKLPLLIGFHGRTANARFFREQSLIDTFVPTEKFIAILINGSVDQWSSWNAGDCCAPATQNNIDDVGLVSTIIDQAIATSNIDLSRIWAVGHSNGGMMAYRLACDLSDKITAIAVVTGAQTDPTCSPTKPVSILHIHGNLDPTVPFHGGGKFETPSIFHSVQDMAYRNLCSGKPKESSNAIEERYIWVCTSGVETQLVNYQEQSHGWENGYTEEILRFLFTHPRK